MFKDDNETTDDVLMIEFVLQNNLFLDLDVSPA
jgi:hypothetical protein